MEKNHNIKQPVWLGGLDEGHRMQGLCVRERERERERMSKSKSKSKSERKTVSLTIVVGQR